MLHNAGGVSIIETHTAPVQLENHLGHVGQARGQGVGEVKLAITHGHYIIQATTNTCNGKFCCSYLLFI